MRSTITLGILLVVGGLVPVMIMPGVGSLGRGDLAVEWSAVSLVFLAMSGVGALLILGCGVHWWVTARGSRQ